VENQKLLNDILETQFEYENCEPKDRDSKRLALRALFDEVRKLAPDFQDFEIKQALEGPYEEYVRTRMNRQKKTGRTD
jgi:hypothetical protein